MRGVITYLDCCIREITLTKCYHLLGLVCQRNHIDQVLSLTWIVYHVSERSHDMMHYQQQHSIQTGQCKQTTILSFYLKWKFILSYGLDIPILRLSSK